MPVWLRLQGQEVIQWDNKSITVYLFVCWTVLGAQFHEPMCELNFLSLLVYVGYLFNGFRSWLLEPFWNKFSYQPIGNTWVYHPRATLHSLPSHMALGLFSRGSPCNMLSRNVVSIPLSRSISSLILDWHVWKLKQLPYIVSDTTSDDISSMSLKCSVVLALKRSSGLQSSGSTSFSSSWLSLGKN